MAHNVAAEAAINISTVLGWAIGLIGITFSATIWLIKDKYEREGAQQDKDSSEAYKQIDDKFSERLMNLAKSYDTEIIRLIDQMKQIDNEIIEKKKKLHELELRTRELEIRFENIDQMRFRRGLRDIDQG